MPKRRSARRAPAAPLPSLPPELVSIIVGYLDPEDWSTARALSVAYRDAVHEVTKRPEALGRLLESMELECPAALFAYDNEDEAAEELLLPHFPELLSSDGKAHSRLAFAQLNLKLMLDLTAYMHRLEPFNVVNLSTTYAYMETREHVEKFAEDTLDIYLQDPMSLDVAELISTLRWVMLRMVDRVRFASFYVERPTVGVATQFNPLLWEWK